MNRIQFSSTALLLGFVVSAFPSQVPPNEVYFTVNGTGFAFLRPKAWKMEKTKREQRLYIPTAPGHPPAIMHFYPVAYRLPASDWQQTQVVAAPDLKRSVERQWQEEVLGIPLLLTKTTGVTKQGAPDVALTGLLYSATVNKMLFRLTCSAADFDGANTAWRAAFLSLRTTDGSKPSADDPGRTLTKDELAAKPAAPLPVTLLESPPKPVKLVKGPVSVAGKAGGKNAVIRLPVGWVAKPQADGTWLLSAPTVSGGITMSLASILDSDPPRSALFKLGNTSLESFVTVKDRDEADDETNRAGAFVNSIWRYGASAKGPLTTCDANVRSGELYILLHFRADAVLPPPQRKAIHELLAGTTIDFAP